MPVQALSLLGFMDRNFALSYLSDTCIIPNNSHQGLVQLWDAARALKGEPMDRAGRPNIGDVPSDFDEYLQRVRANPRFNSTVLGSNWQFKLVEIDPLLALQFHIEVGKAEDLGALAGPAPNVADLLPVCLPHSLEDIAYSLSVQQNGMLIRTRSFNLRMLKAGHVGADPVQQVSFAGIAFGASSPLIRVVRFQGRCYLKNGLHRAFGLRKAGVTHVPCLFLDVSDFGQVGAVGAGSTFERALLESEDPPTCGHFTQGRACRLAIRRIARMISVTWSEHVFRDEE